MQVHRHRGRVAVYIGTGATVYLFPKEAAKLARALNKTARDVEKFPNWTDQPHASTVEIDAADPLRTRQD